MEELIGLQHEIYGRISHTWDNLKKAGQQNITRDLVRSTLTLLDAKWNRLEDQHATLLQNHFTALQKHDYIKEDFMGQAEVTYTTQRTQLLQLERQRSASDPSEASNSADPSPGAHAEAAPAQGQSFPRIELPKFSGQFEDWPSFRDLFLSMVIEEKALPNVRKLHYLKTSVTGEADSLLRNLPTTDENFVRAWTTLKEHYENKRLLVRSYLNTFTSLPKMRPNSMVDLKRIFHGMMTTAGALEGIGRPVTSSEDLFVHLVVNLLDQTTRREWDKTLRKSSDPPSLACLQTFLKEQVTSEEALEENRSRPTAKPTLRSGRVAHVAQQRPRPSNPGRACPICNGAHFIATCEEYLKRDPQGRRDLTAKHSRCFNCLGRHLANLCTSTKNCQKCSGRHHTSLHDAFSTAASPTNAASPCASVHTIGQSASKSAAVLLATARVWVTDALGRDHPVRALVDPGSETSFVSESLAQRIRLPRAPACVAIYGVGGQQSSVARGRITFTVSARERNSALTVTALVLPRLTVYNGAANARADTWKHVQGLQLADPEFLQRDAVELLLGADAYANIVMRGLHRGNQGEPVAQQTSLGWILLGGNSDGQPVPAVRALHCAHEEQDISTALRRFWEWEEPAPIVSPTTKEEDQCEQFFCDTVVRSPDGRFQVRLPFRSHPAPQLAHTKHAAVRMLKALDRRFARDSDFRRRYEEFMEEYLRLHHMSPVSQASPTITGQLCYLPHHGVLKGSGSTSKLRVVFNGSARTSNGTSLNDSLLPGPNLLPLLPEVVLRWRRHQFAFITDIEKMYRQISVHPSDRDYQRILWTQDGMLREFHLNTVTYGTACAPFLAIRVLRRLAEEEGEKYPMGAAALRHDSYVDDILSGASTLETGKQLQQELSSLCTAGGFPLRKWAANHPGMLEGVPITHRQCSSTFADLPLTEHSVLGLRWCPSNDYLMVAVAKLPQPIATKRVILSQVARLFDPLGWLAPLVVLAKLLIQTAWLQQLDWDTPLAPQETAMWNKLMDDLPAIEDIKIPRWFCGFAEGSSIEVHGFSDASERAFGAVIYLRITHQRGLSVSFVQAKTKVAPLKRVSLPRLELCGAALLAKLSVHVREALGLMNVPTFHWTDSMVALSWIRGHPAKWTTFVANRVADIQRMSNSVSWRHVPGTENPADYASRGLLPRELVSHSMWWQGPSFLRKDPSLWPHADAFLQDSDIPDQRPLSCLVSKQEYVEPEELTRFSSLQRLLRVTSWILRWKPRQAEKTDATVSGELLTLQPQEMDRALTRWIRISQHGRFAAEFEDVRAGRAVHVRSVLRKLTPFIDLDGILRVGGRLKHSLLDADQKHPIILAPDSHLTRLIIEAHHRRTLHGGTQATLASIRQRYWPLRGRQLVKRTILRCPICIRWRAATPQPLMSDLPPARAAPSRPFLHVGVDYAGPIRLRTSKGRGHRSYKGFLCIFVCFSTRAVHLEVATDYTAIAFLASFRRFVSRRGFPTAIYSDRGTNFVGVDSELRALFTGAAPDARFIAGRLADEGIRWVFNPPAAPHFGGLWEAAVRSVKHHLRRVVGDATLTYEEMATLLAEVEACLNSRPLQALSDDPDDVTALTPGHFLVGEPLLAIPEATLIDIPANRLSRWRMLQQMRDHLWARWSQEYLQSLTPRPKWWKETEGLKEGQLCIIKDESSSPTRWPLARVVRLHRGKDGHVRVADLKTATGTLSRPIIKLVPLPFATVSSE